MKTPGTLRLALIGLLLVSTATFLAGVLAERAANDTDDESAAVVRSGEPTSDRDAEQDHATHNEATEAGEAGHTGDNEEAGEEQHANTSPHSEGHEEATLLGIDPESTPLIVIAVLAGLALAALAATRVGTNRAFLLLVVAATVLWAALDIRELIHQIDESRAGIAVIAATVAVLHLATAAIATLLARTRGAASRPGLSPAQT
jgi:hypothetical protein